MHADITALDPATALPAALAVYTRVTRADPTFFPGHPNVDELRDWFAAKPLDQLWVARDPAARPIGLVALSQRPPTGLASQPSDPNPQPTIELCRMAVDPRWQGHGIATALHATALAWAAENGHTRAWLRCIADTPADRLYRAHGWQFYAHATSETAAATGDVVLLARHL